MKEQMPYNFVKGTFYLFRCLKRYAVMPTHPLKSLYIAPSNFTPPREMSEEMSEKKLGILINTDKNLRHIIGLCNAAKAAKVGVSLFIMDEGCFLTEKAEFMELCKSVKTVMCDHSYKEKGYTEELAEVKHGSQFEHALIANECDRYIVL